MDILSRAIGSKMAQSMGQPVVVENKAGASAAIGTEMLAKSPPDGYTIMMGYSAHATNLSSHRACRMTRTRISRRSRSSATFR